MKNVHILGFMSLALLIGCTGEGITTTTTSTPSSTPNTTTQAPVECKSLAPTLKTIDTKYLSAKDEGLSNLSRVYSAKGSSDDGKGSSDDGKGSGDGGSHNEGRNCLACHSFASAGTVFTSLNAPDNTPGAAGYRIKLSDGTVFGTGYGTGNSYTYSFPSGNYTAQVIDPNGNVVNSSAEMSHDASRRACNSCHTATGNNGAPGRITSKKLSSNTPTLTEAVNACVSFSGHVMPILEAKCKACHGKNGNFEVTTPNATHANISALPGGAQYLLDKGTNTISHGGGGIIAPSSAEYTTIKAWITEGAANN